MTSTAKTASILAFQSIIHSEHSSFKFGAIKLLDNAIDIFHLHKTEAARSAGYLVCRYFNGQNFTELREKIFDRLFTA